MPTIPYVSAAGARLPGTTTVIGNNCGWNKDALKYWAWNEGREGRDFRASSKKAANIGTLAHGMVEAHIRGLPFEPEVEFTAEMLKLAELAFGSYLAWERNYNPVIIATEINMVSEKYGYGATPDAVSLIEGKLALLDWKTSNGTYADHVIQLAAYGAAFEEVTGMPLEGGFHLCRFGKDAPTFTHHFWSRELMAVPWRNFLRLRGLHEDRRYIESLAK